VTPSVFRARNSRRALRALPVAVPWLPPTSAVPASARLMVTRRLLMGADLTGPVLAYAVTEYLVLHVGSTPPRDVVAFTAFLPFWGVAAQVGGLYRHNTGLERSTTDELARIVGVVTVSTWAYVLIASFAGALEWSARRLGVFWVLAVLFVACGRAAARAAARRHPACFERAIVIGTGDTGRLVVRKLRRHSEYGITPIGFIDLSASATQVIDDTPVLGTPERLPELVEALQIHRVVVAVPADDGGALLTLIHRLRAGSVQVDMVPTFFEATDPRATLHFVETLPLVGLAPVHHGQAARACKRIIDMIVASAALLVVSPLLAAVAWRVRRDSPGPVFFRQTRLGMHMRPFTTLKFRTMWTGVDDTSHRDYIRSTMTAQASVEGNGLYKLERHDDVTPFGRFLRRWSIDELPQLINVVRGDMSLVGPRPCIPYETENFAPHHFDRFLVPAGVTGLWQVAARARATFGEQLEMDVAYARGWSLGLDLRLLCRTPLAVLRQEATA